jgi:hypothetical protein
MKSRFAFLMPAMALWAGCNLINPAEPIPAYLRIDSFAVEASPAFGSAAHRIQDVYVVVNSVSLGAYPLPATFPVLASGECHIVLSPGIVVNGISNARGIYPFYDNDARDAVLTPGEITAVAPVVRYRSVTVSWLEDFESSMGFSLEATAASQTPVTGFPAGDPGIFEGGNSGRVVLEDPDAYFDLVCAPDVDLSINTSIFLEMHYRCNGPFDVGVEASYGANSQRIALLTVHAKDSWTKLYIDVNPGVVAMPGANHYKVYFAGTRDGGQATLFVHFDNLKLLHD